MLIMLILIALIIVIAVTAFLPAAPSIRFAALTGDWKSLKGERSPDTTVVGPELYWGIPDKNNKTNYSNEAFVNCSRYVIGRCGDLKLDSPYVEPYHAMIIQKIEDGACRFYIQNLSKINPMRYLDHDKGVFLALEYRETYPLEPNRIEKFNIGNFRMKIKAPSEVTANSVTLTSTGRRAEKAAARSDKPDKLWRTKTHDFHTRKYESETIGRRDDDEEPEAPHL